VLDPWIIEQIRRREQEKREGERPFLELPLSDDDPFAYGERPVGGESESGTQRGVVIIGI